MSLSKFPVLPGQVKGEGAAGGDPHRIGVHGRMSNSAEILEPSSVARL